MSAILNGLLKLGRLHSHKPIVCQDKLRQVSRLAKSTAKRIVSKSRDTLHDGHCSITAYNISDGLQIDKSQDLLKTFYDYEINKMPDDLKHEAVMLSLKNKKDPIHDIFIFREGSIVFWGVSYEKQRRILYGLSPLKIEPNLNELIQEERECLIYKLDHTIQHSRLSRDIVQLACSKDGADLHLDQFAISHAIALSVKLGIWEILLDKYIDSIAWITDNMKSGKSIHLTRHDVFKKIGQIYELKHNLILSSDLLDLPDVYWDRHEQEILFLSVLSFLNIRKRTSVMTEKLNNCVELMALLSTHMSDKHHIRLEWMIIALILVEVLFELSRSM